MPKSMIFHYPFPTYTENAGSQVWVLQMIKAFTQLGYEVELAIGHAEERRKAIERIQAQAKQGRKFDFVFSEAATSPSLLTKKNAVQPLLDLNFFSWCKSQQIPVGLFYIDVHWRFDHWRKNVTLRRWATAWPLFWYDWFSYLGWVDRLYLPSLRMATALPTRWPAKRLTALPPGCIITDLPKPERVNDRLELFYVGGIAPPLYDLKAMVDIVQSLDNISLTFCCRTPEWEKFQTYYAVTDTTKVKVVHAHGAELKNYYAQADLFGLFWQPYPYLNITMPVKVMETLGYGLPLITTAGTVSADFVAQEKIGWVASTANEFRELLLRLQADRTLIAEKRARALAIREQHTWRERARVVADTLGQGKQVDR